MRSGNRGVGFPIRLTDLRAAINFGNNRFQWKRNAA